MRKYLLGITAAFSLVPDPAQGCRVATAGPEYDALIKIESSDPAGGEFWLVFPGVVDGHPFAWVRMDVANSSDVEQRISVVLETEERDELVAARFWSFGAAGLDVNVYVTWQGRSNPCPVIGQKTIKLSD
jgi:hypothetical protein